MHKVVQNGNEIFQKDRIRLKIWMYALHPAAIVVRMARANTAGKRKAGKITACTSTES